MNKYIILPTYNEAENLPKLIPALLDLPIHDLHILIVDDNSPDGTGQIADDLSIQFPGLILVEHRDGKKGLGSAYIHGFGIALAAGADIVGQMDSDFSHPVEKIPEMLEKVKDVDIVIGSRYIKGGSVDVAWPVWRKALSAWGNYYARTILRLPIRDVTGGFRLWKRHVLENLPLERIGSNGYIFQVEIAYLSHLYGFSFGEVPIYFADRKWGDSKMNFNIQVEAALRVWQILFSYQDIKKIPG